MEGQVVKMVRRGEVDHLHGFAASLSGWGLPRHHVPTAFISRPSVAGITPVPHGELEYKPDTKTGADTSSECSLPPLSSGGTASGIRSPPGIVTA